MCALTVREIETTEELESLRAGWLALYQRSSLTTPFQSPDWLVPWWKHFGAGRLCLLAFHDGTQLVGIAALFIVNAEGRRSLRLLGTGNTDYLDIIFDDRVHHDGTDALRSYLCESRHAWDECDFQNLRPCSPLVSMKPCAELVQNVQEQDSCPVLSLPSSTEVFLSNLPPRFRHNLEYCRRRLANSRIECASKDNFSELFNALLRLHETRWRMTHASGVLSDRNVQDFHRDAATELLSHGALRMYALRVADGFIAAFYGFHQAARTYYYLSGFDPRFRQYSPGTILVAHAITEAIREGAKEFDFLRGREDYKYRWGAVDQIIYRKRLAPALPSAGASLPS
jgi:CelD/BcsL family acetyltransferase involved in cellulose biosynthesis